MILLFFRKENKTKIGLWMSVRAYCNIQGYAYFEEYKNSMEMERREMNLFSLKTDIEFVCDDVLRVQERY